jgi:hypothetical protein
MDKIKQQANTVSQLVFSAETGNTYRKTLILTWDILRETALLVWLVICLVFVGGEWFYRNSVQLGRNTRVWYNGLGEKAEGREAEAAATSGEALLTSVKSGTSFLLSRAREQLGMPEPQPTPESPAPPPKKAPSEPTPAGTASTAAQVSTVSTPTTEVEEVDDQDKEDDEETG